MIKIDSKSSKPIYEQIIDGMKENIARGILKPGDKLPSVRELSVIITANPNTVSKAYIELEREKVIETFRGKGTFVALDFNPSIDKDKMKDIKESLKKIVLDSYYMGITKEELIKILNDYFEELQ